MTEHPEIEQLLADWKEAIAAKDVEAILEMVAPDAVFWAQGAPPMEGRAALRATFESVFGRFEFRQDFDLDEIIVRDDVAVVRGMERNHLVPIGVGEPFELEQRAVSILFRGKDGRWRFARGITNRPPSASGAKGAGA